MALMTMPKTTWTFSAYTFDDNTESENEVKVEFSAREETLSEVLEKMTDFLRAAGFGYIDELEPITRTNFSNTSYDDPHAEPQPDIPEEQWDSFFNALEGGVSDDFMEEHDGQLKFDFTQTTPVETDFKLDISMQPVDLTVSPYGTSYSTTYNVSPSIGDATVKVRNSIDECTPAEWSEASRKVMNYSKK